MPAPDPKPADTSEQVIEPKDDDVGELGEAHADIQEQPLTEPKED